MKIHSITKALIQNGKFFGTPFIFINLYGCSQKCENCPVSFMHTGDTYKETSLFELINILNLPNSGINICISGGEPFCSEPLELLRLVKILKNKKCFVLFQTNGQYFDGVKLLKRYVDYWTISINNESFPLEYDKMIRYSKFKNLEFQFFISNKGVLKSFIESIGGTIKKIPIYITPTGGFSYNDLLNYCDKYSVFEHYLSRASIHFSPLLVSFIDKQSGFVGVPTKKDYDSVLQEAIQCLPKIQ